MDDVSLRVAFALLLFSAVIVLIVIASFDYWTERRSMTPEEKRQQDEDLKEPW
jgi:uncharacterized iron-regulated membrane protein